MNFKSSDFAKAIGFFLFAVSFNYFLSAPLSDCSMLTVSSWTDENDLKNQYAECQERWHNSYWTTTLGVGIFTTVLILLMGFFRPKYPACHEKSATELKE